MSNDQRGIGRPLDLPTLPNAGDGCDIGAVEADWQMIAVSPVHPYAVLDPGETSVQVLTVGNDGPLPLDFDLDLSGSAAWLSLDPTSGALPPSSSTPVDLTVDATGLAPGVHRTQFAVLSDDPTLPVLDVGVDLFVGVAWNEVRPYSPRPSEKSPWL